MLRSAIEKVGDDEGCRQGRPDAVGRLLTEIVKLVQDLPKNRNMYLNPNRADQVLVFVPERWETYSLYEGIRLIFGQVTSELGEVAQFAPAPIRATAQAAQEGFRTQGPEIIKKSSAAMSAHFGSMSSRAANEDWLGNTLEKARGACKTRLFEKELAGHLSVSDVSCALARDLELQERADAEAAVKDGTMKVKAHQAVYTFARLLLINHPENLTVRPLPESEGKVRINSPRGWLAIPIAEAARRQAQTIVATLSQYLDTIVLETDHAAALAPLARQLLNDAREIVASEGVTLTILTQYLVAARRYHVADG